MGGLAFIAPLGSAEAETPGGVHSTTTKPSVWPAPHGYAGYQLNGNLWLGLGVFSRFGLGNRYAGTWIGRYNIYDVGVQTVSAAPALAGKLNETVSVPLGVEALHAGMYLGSKIPSLGPLGRFDNVLQAQGAGWGLGAHAGVHMRFNEQWSAGLFYKSQVTLNLNGDADVACQGDNPLAGPGHLPQARDCSLRSTMQLPDSLALGIACKPLENLSLEVGTVWTRWSAYTALNISFDSGYAAVSTKEWRDGWNFNASVEYGPLDWLRLRAGVSWETPVVNKAHADYSMPVNGRTMLSLGSGFVWDTVAVDLAYAHIRVNPVRYDATDAAGIRGGPAGISGGHWENVAANTSMFPVSYAF